MFPRRARGELLCKTSLVSPHMLSVLSCLKFRSGWTGAAHPSATQFFRAALAENCFPRPPFDLPICCVLSCLNFCSGWTGAAHSSANQCFRAAPAENCCARPPLHLTICCQFSPVLISARGGRALRTPAQLNVSAPHLRRIAFQDLPSISLFSPVLISARGGQAPRT